MAAPQPGGGQQDNSAAMLWGVAAGFAALGGIWFAFRDYLISCYLYIKLAEANFLRLVGGSHFDQIQASIVSALNDPKRLGFYDVIHLGDSVGDYLRFPFVILLFVLAFLVYLGNSTRVFKRTYSMMDFAQEEKVSWPQIAAPLQHDLLHTDIDTGPWAMAMTPMQFCKKYHLLEEFRQQRREGMSRKEWDKVEVTLKRGEANKIFVLQLGSLWRGINKQPPHIKALFAAFAARINADSKVAENLFLQINISSTKKLNFSSVDELCKKYENTKEVQKIIQSHAYVLTVMASMLAGAREDGVQASADFLWLKPIDRRLWYMLNTVGRQTPFVEVAGPFAHWISEKEAGRKLVVPIVEEATKALETALKEIVYKPEE